MSDEQTWPGGAPLDVHVVKPQDIHWSVKARLRVHENKPTKAPKHIIENSTYPKDWSCTGKKQNSARTTSDLRRKHSSRSMASLSKASPQRRENHMTFIFNDTSAELGSDTSYMVIFLRGTIFWIVVLPISPLLIIIRICYFTVECFSIRYHSNLCPSVLARRFTLAHLFFGLVFFVGRGFVFVPTVTAAPARHRLVFFVGRGVVSPFHMGAESEREEQALVRRSRGCDFVCSCRFRVSPPLELDFPSLSLRSTVATVGYSRLSPSPI